VTNEPNQAYRFLETHQFDCIYKQFRGVDFGPWETRPFHRNDLTDLERLRLCPLILQKHIRGEFDVRVTVVGESMFAARLLYKLGHHPVDSRADFTPVERHDQEMVASIKRLMNKLGLVYGAIDFRFSESEGYTFFEINPEGQYLWIEIETGLPISRAIAEQLTSGTASA
jgi:glutathione synthase/RimK-type ligase-like ATP-grasp enzyme